MRSSLLVVLLLSWPALATTPAAPPQAAPPVATAAPDALTTLLLWNEAIRPRLGGSWREQSLVQVAIHDALNLIERRRPGLVVQTLPGHPDEEWKTASPEATLSAAAFRVLHVTLDEALARTRGEGAKAAVKQQRAELDKVFAQTFGALPNAPERYQGRELGRLVADAVLAFRKGDLKEQEYRRSSVLGAWRPVDNDAPGEVREWVGAKTWVLESPEQFVPPAPPGLTSATYRRDFQEVRCLGRHDQMPPGPACNGRTLTSQQRARTWVMDVSGQTEGMRIARVLVQQAKLPLHEAATVLMQVAVALGDAASSSWTAKERYSVWRPVTAIRAGLDGKAADDTPAEEQWRSRDPVTPHFPEYPAGNVTLLSAATTVLAKRFGDDVRRLGGGKDFAVEFSGEVGGQKKTLRFNRLSEIPRANADSRVFMGHHFRFSVRAGIEHGKKLGAWVYEKLTKVNAPRPGAKTTHATNG